MISCNLKMGFYLKFLENFILYKDYENRKRAF